MAQWLLPDNFQLKDESSSLVVAQHLCLIKYKYYFYLIPVIGINLS